MPARDSTSTSALELRAIEKSFGGVHALRGADLAARPGEILGLCGENGAGKSTLLKILSGVYPRSSYAGSVRVRGEERAFTTTRDAEHAGIAIVHQELMLVPELSVAANLALGREGGTKNKGIFGFVDDDAIEARAEELLRKFGVERDIEPSKPVGVLGIGLQQVVEIVRALSQDASILILDEPTAALTGKETDRLMEWLRGLREAGTTCVYVSHRMDEIFTICDRITVLRDGKTVGTVETAGTGADEVVSMMVGRAVGGKGVRATPLAADLTPTLTVRDLYVPLPGGAIEPSEAGDRVRSHAVAGVSLAVMPGEVLAVCGAMGSGRTALLSTLFGCAEHGFSGQVRIEGREVALGSPRAAIAAGVALIPEDRKGRGLVLGMTVSENLTLPPPRSKIARALEWIGIVDDEEEELVSSRRIKELRIRGAASAEVATLSGGNQQKVVIGKWLEDPPSVLLLDEPTRGVDVGAREEIYGLLAELGNKGTAIVLASSDLPEVLRLAHRIVVLRHGKIAAELDGRTATEEQIVTIATGADAVGASGASPRPIPPCLSAISQVERSMAVAHAPTATPPFRTMIGSRSLRTVFVLLLMWTVLAVHPETREAFVTSGNFSNLTAQVAEIVIIGVGMTLVILIGGIDLSVGAGMALAGVVAAKLQIDMQQPAWVAVLAAVAVCGAIGAWHGLLVTRFGIPPFIATLSGFLAYRGLGLVLSDARGLSPMAEDFQKIGGRLPPALSLALCGVGLAIGASVILRRAARRKRLGLPVDSAVVLSLKLGAVISATAFAATIYKEGVPVPVLIAVIAAALGALLLRRTRLGRYAFAIGGNTEAARLSGVPVVKVTMTLYIAIGVLTALAGIVAAARTNGVTPGNAGLMRELHVITAVVIGGTSLTGGRGTMLGTVIGALIFGTLSNGMNLMGVNSNWQLIVTGQILLGASLLDALSSKKR